MIYEAHTIGEKELPFIFHYDTVKKHNLYDIANWHRNIEILFFTDGYGTAVCDTTSYSVAPGDIIVINSNSTHYVKRDCSKMISFCCSLFIFSLGLCIY